MARPAYSPLRLRYLSVIISAWLHRPASGSDLLRSQVKSDDFRLTFDFWTSSASCSSFTDSHLLVHLLVNSTTSTRFLHLDISTTSDEFCCELNLLFIGLPSRYILFLFLLHDNWLSCFALSFFADFSFLRTLTLTTMTILCYRMMRPLIATITFVDNMWTWYCNCLMLD